MLIEVCGPDGSGKSTLVDGLRARVREAGHVAYERTLRSESRNLLEIVQQQSHGFSPREFELAVLLDAVSQSTGELTKYVRNPTTHVFVQQYRCALLARLLRRGLAGHGELLALLDHVTVPDLSVRLLVSDFTCMARIRGRRKGDGLLARPSPATEMRALVQAFDDAAERLPYPQVDLDAELPADELLDLAWKHLAPYSSWASNSPKESSVQPRSRQAPVPPSGPS
ncbi:hypothetical protein ACGFH8_10040 [Micromonospora sp. NPDC049175]|uniref:hypothetical protein n=1 Tax=Micromonospora sp. NPDC049175 TaxID=3364266 RepID=UPI0037155B31